MVLRRISIPEYPTSWSPSPWTIMLTPARAVGRPRLRSIWNPDEWPVRYSVVVDRAVIRSALSIVSDEVGELLNGDVVDAWEQVNTTACRRLFWLS